MKPPDTRLVSATGETHHYNPPANSHINRRTCSHRRLDLFKLHDPQLLVRDARRCCTGKAGSRPKVATCRRGGRKRERRPAGVALFMRLTKYRSLGESGAPFPTVVRPAGNFVVRELKVSRETPAQTGGTGDEGLLAPAAAHTLCVCVCGHVCTRSYERECGTRASFPKNRPRWWADAHVHVHGRRRTDAHVHVAAHRWE